MTSSPLFSTLSNAYRQQPYWLKTLATWSFLIALMAGLASGLLTWPHEDEANYLIQARWIAEGQVPYRDFFEFITPAGQYLTSLLYQSVGFTIIGIRFLVLAGWIIEIVLLFKLARLFMPLHWCWLMAAFLWATDTRYIVHQHPFWSGFCVLLATYFACHYVQYKHQKYLVLSGILAGLAPWITQSSGVLGLLGFGIFCILTQQQSLKTWLRYWLLPALGVSVFWIILLLTQGAWPDFWQDAVLWLWHGNYTKTTQVGYFVTLGEELHTTILPLLHPLSWPTKLFYAFRLPIALQLLLLAGLPLLGILGNGWQLWQQHLKQPVKPPQQILLLVTLNAAMMVLATCSYSTSMHLTSNGGLGLLCGFIVLQSLFAHAQWPLISGWVLYALFQIQAVLGSVVILAVGTWFPSLSTLPYDTMVYSYGPDAAQQYLNTVWYLNDAHQKEETVFTFSQSQSLYLASPAKNATRFRLVLPVYTTRQQQAEILEDLQKNQPLYIINDQSMTTIGRDHRFTQYSAKELHLPGIESFIQSHYQLLNQHDRYLIYRRR